MENMSIVRVLTAVCFGVCASMAAGDVGATTYTYPGCAVSLQGCVDAASTGDTVQIATNTPIDEDILIHKSLTLKSAAGYTGTLSQGAFAHVVAIYAAEPAPYPNLTVTVQGLTFQGGYVSGSAYNNSLTLTVEDCVITVPPEDTSGFVAIAATSHDSDPGGAGPLNITARNNRISLPDKPINAQYGAEGIFIESGIDPGSAGGTVLIEGNSIAMGDGNSDQYGNGLEIINGVGVSTAVVRQNVITGSNFNDGILIYSGSAAAGSVAATVVDNLVTGEDGSVGTSAAIAVNGDTRPYNMFIANNTVSGNAHGLQAFGSHPMTSGSVINNIVANSSIDGIVVDPSITNSNNLVFNNPVNFYTPGSGTVVADPKFVGGGDFHLLGGSPAFNVGSSAVLTQTAVDLDGAPRSFGGGVDIGAYESQCTYAGTTVSCSIGTAGGQAGPATATGPKVIIPAGAVPNGTTISISSSATSQYGAGNNGGNLVGGSSGFTSTDTTLAVCADGTNAGLACSSAGECPGGTCQFTTMVLPWSPGPFGTVGNSGIAATALKLFRNGNHQIGTCASGHLEVLCTDNGDLPCPGGANCNTKTCGQQGCPAGSALCCDLANNRWILHVSKFSEYAAGIDACQPMVALLKITKVFPPAGDDGLRVLGDIQLTSAYIAAEIDPVTNGVRLGLTDGDTAVVDVMLAAGAYDRVARVGWKVNKAGNSWKYINKSATPPGNIIAAALQDRSSKGTLGLLRFKFKGRDGAYAAGPGVVVDVTLPGLQNCFEETYPGPAPVCTEHKNTLQCQ